MIRTGWCAGPGVPAGARWLVGEGAEVVALDLSAGMLRHAAAAAAESGVRVPLVQADALALPFGAAAFDTVCTAFGAVPFVADSAAVMREVFRVLRPGGRWVFSITHPIKWVGSCHNTGHGIWPRAIKCSRARTRLKPRPGAP